MERSIEVTNGANLVAILKEFPTATVKRLVSDPGEDAWRVTIPNPVEGMIMETGETFYPSVRPMSALLQWAGAKTGRHSSTKPNVEEVEEPMAGRNFRRGHDAGFKFACEGFSAMLAGLKKENYGDEAGEWGEVRTRLEQYRETVLQRGMDETARMVIRLIENDLPAELMNSEREPWPTLKKKLQPILEGYGEWMAGKAREAARGRVEPTKPAGGWVIRAIRRGTMAAAKAGVPAFQYFNPGSSWEAEPKPWPTQSKARTMKINLRSPEHYAEPKVAWQKLVEAPAVLNTVKCYGVKMKPKPHHNGPTLYSTAKGWTDDSDQIKPFNTLKEAQQFVNGAVGDFEYENPVVFEFFTDPEPAADSPAVKATEPKPLWVVMCKHKSQPNTRRWLGKRGRWLKGSMRYAMPDVLKYESEEAAATVARGVMDASGTPPFFKDAEPFQIPTLTTRRKKGTHRGT